MQKKARKVREQLMAVTVVGIALIACQSGLPAQASAREAEQPHSTRTLQKTVQLRLFEGGQLLEQVKVTGQVGQKARVNYPKNVFRNFVVRDDDHQFSRLPIEIIIPRDGSHVDLTIDRRYLSQKQVHDVVVTIRPFTPKMIPIEGITPETVKFKVTARFDYDRYNGSKNDIKYSIDPGNLIVFHPRQLPGYQLRNTGGLEMKPQSLVKNPDNLSLFYDNDSSEPLHFTRDAIYTPVTPDTDSQPDEQEQPRNDEQPGKGDVPSVDDNDQPGPKNEEDEKEVNKENNQVNDQPNDQPAGGDTSEGSANNDDQLAQEDNKTVQDEQENDSIKEGNSQEEMGNQMAGTHDNESPETPTGKQHADETVSQTTDQPQQAGGEPLQQERRPEQPGKNEKLTAEEERLNELARQLPPESAGDRLPQTGDNNRLSIVSAISGLVTSLVSLLLVMLHLRKE